MSARQPTSQKTEAGEFDEAVEREAHRIPGLRPADPLAILFAVKLGWLPVAGNYLGSSASSSGTPAAGHPTAPKSAATIDVLSAAGLQDELDHLARGGLGGST